MKISQLHHQKHDSRNIHQMNWVVIIIIIWHSKTKTCDVQSTFLFYSCKKKIIHSRKEKPHYSISKTVIINCSPNTVRHARHVDEKISASFFLLLNVACLSILYVISVVCELLLRLPWTYIYIILCTKNKTHEDDDDNEQRENANRCFFSFFKFSRLNEQSWWTPQQICAQRESRQVEIEAVNFCSSELGIWSCVLFTQTSNSQSRNGQGQRRKKLSSNERENISATWNWKLVESLFHSHESVI